MDEAQGGIKIDGKKKSITSDMQMTPLFWQRRPKQPLDKNERVEGKSWLKAEHSKN